MHCLRKRLLSASYLLVATVAFGGTPPIKVVSDHPDGMYKSGETVNWSVTAAGDLTGLSAVPYAVKLDGANEVAKGTLDLSSGTAAITASAAGPGALLAQVQSPDSSAKAPLAAGGALIAPEKIPPAVPAPADFDTFWGEKLQELAKVPVDPVLEKVENLPGTDGVDYFKVTLGNIRGTHVRGQLARPSKEGKFPAMLIVQWAGVYPLDKNPVLSNAKAGWLVLNINAHDLPIDESPEFYKQQIAGPLKDYTFQGNEDRETSYFLRMFLGCVRAADYLASRPDWDGRVLVVTGVSQGGLQSFVTAALCPKITGVMVMVPAGCDALGPKAVPPRAPSWPYWLSPWGLKNRDAKKVEQTAGYYDATNFAARIKAPSLVAVGLLDETSRPSGVLAAFNLLQGPKELVVMPESDHKGLGGKQAAFFRKAEEWKSAFKKGSPVPISTAER